MPLHPAFTTALRSTGAEVVPGGWLERAEAFLAEHSALLGWLTTGSILFLVVSLVALPWLVARLPHDYFTAEGQDRIHRERRAAPRHPVISFLLHGLRNLCGVLVALAGVAMLVLPGQGILAILIGMMLIDYPFKHRFERWLIRRPAVHKPLNWLRGKASKEAYTTPPPHRHA